MKKLLIPLLTTGLLAFVMSQLVIAPETTVSEAPQIALNEISGYTSEALEPSEAELNVLPSDTTIVKRLYKTDTGHWFLVSVVIGGTSKRSIHRPELCLPSQGYLMSKPRQMDVRGTEWRVLTLDGKGARASLGFAYTFFNQAGYRTSSHLKRIFRDIWDRSVCNQIDRWVMVTVTTSRFDDAGLSEILAHLERTVKP